MPDKRGSSSTPHRPATQVHRPGQAPGSPAQRGTERAHLRVLHDGRSVIAPLSEHPFIIGRSDQNLTADEARLLLPDPYVSRRHALLEYVDGTYFIRDAGSLNGLLLNGQRVSGSRPLENKDRITIGDFEVTFLDPRRDMVEFPPEPWGDWIFERYIDGGGMARVYRARFSREVDKASPLAKPLAIKVPRYGTQNFDELCGMLVREGAVMQRLGHPNVVKAFRYGMLPCGWPFIAMEYVEGGTLRDYMNRCGGTIPEGPARRIISEIAEALAYIHTAGIIHCDIKPDNILMSGKQVRLADFGIAVTVSEGYGHEWCSYHYISPEHLQGGKLTPRSDIYMLGCLLHEMLTGEVPFEGDESEVTERKTTGDGHSIRDRFKADKRIDVSPAMDELVQAMLKRRPEDRLPDAKALILSK